MAQKYTRQFSHSITSALTTNDDPLFLLEYTGSSDSTGMFLITSDGMRFMVGSDTDDTDATDELESDNTAGSDTDFYASGVVNFVSTDYTFSDVLEVVNYSQNWDMRLVTGLPEDGFLTTDAVNTDTHSDAAAVTRGTGAYVYAYKAGTDNMNGGTDLGSTSTNLITVRLCIAPENDTTNADPLSRRSEAKTLGFDPQPTDSDLSTTRTSEGQVYIPVDRSAKIDTLNIDATTSTDIAANDLKMYVIAQKAGAAGRLVHSQSISSDTTSDTTAINATFTVDNTAAWVSRPGERLVVVVASTATDLTNALTGLTASATGRWGDWDALNTTST